MEQDELKKLKADIIVDAKGKMCPEPLIMTKKAVDAAGPGNLLEVWSNDAGTKRDLPAWADKMGHKYLGFILEHSQGVFYRIFIVKKG